jgi:MYXO-CTERM domain-containing protein
MLLSSTLAAAPLQAGVITQDNNQYLAFEAEDNFTPNSSPDWTVTTDALATNGKGLLASTKSPTPGEATYQLKFAAPGDYYFFPRLRSTIDGTTADSHDSFFVSIDGGGYFSVNQKTNGTNYFWNTSIASILTIAPSDVGRLIPVTFQVKADKVMVDRIVLATVSIQDANSLDAMTDSSVSTPEPTGAITLSALLLGALARRRRR